MANTKTIRAAVLGASGYTGADMIRLAALHPALQAHRADRQGPCRAAPRASVPASCQPRCAETCHSRRGELGRRRRRLLRLAPWHGARRNRQAPQARQDHRHVGRFSPARSEALCRMVRQRAQRARADQGRGLRADRALSRQDQNSAARGLSRLLSDRRAAGAPAACQGEADRARRHHHRCQVRRLRRRPHAEAEHLVFGSGRGALALRHRQSPPRARDRAGARTGLRHCRHHQLHAASCADVARRALHLLCAARRQGVARGSPQGARQGLCG